jgi:hypothetical protein
MLVAPVSRTTEPVTDRNLAAVEVEPGQLEQAIAWVPTEALVVAEPDLPCLGLLTLAAVEVALAPMQRQRAQAAAVAVALAVRPATVPTAQ